MHTSKCLACHKGSDSIWNDTVLEYVGALVVPHPQSVFVCVQLEFLALVEPSIVDLARIPVCSIGSGRAENKTVLGSWWCTGSAMRRFLAVIPPCQALVGPRMEGMSRNNPLRCTGSGSA